MRKRGAAGQGGDGTSQAANLMRGLAILRAFTADDAWLGNQDLIERTGLPKATVSRLTGALVPLGYLLYDDQLGRYRLGPSTVSLGYSALSSSAVVHVAGPLMQDLADRTGVAVALGTRDGLEMVYLANARTQGPVSLRLNVGSRLPVWRTAMGLAWIAAARAERRDWLLTQLVAAEPDHAAEIRRAVAEAQGQHQALGFVASCGQWFSYINAVGVAFRPTDGSPLVAITCGGIVDMVPPARCEAEIGPGLLRLAERLRATLNGLPELGRAGDGPAPARLHTA